MMTATTTPWLPMDDDDSDEDDGTDAGNGTYSPNDKAIFPVVIHFC